MATGRPRTTADRAGAGVIKPARRYRYTDDLWLVSCFYNPSSYRTKPTNFDAFIERIERANLNYLIVECAFGGQPFSLRKSERIIQMRASDVMWQKERLLNIAIQRLPARCKTVVWADCDLLFENPDWAIETADKLRHYRVVQPFTQAIRLPKGTDRYTGVGERYWSFAYVAQRNPYLALSGRFDRHGHTGFAWASHRSILREHGLYDVCIAGTADHLMAHSFIGDWSSGCVDRVFGGNAAFFNHYKRWSERVYESVKARISYVDGTVLHLWHGEVKDRHYVDRQKMLAMHQFTPSRHLRLDARGCWAWTKASQPLTGWAKQYFELRKED